ncbi:hypothetical protein JQ557_04140 [Bradyrhizobium sp. U87765 SZCCT0131]|uniref:hypothetical protein n=1 Tax=unclassified Bradyrhizobium TaxID=2631580 RepID=UPI001BA5710C|nr:MULTISPECIES: hypothetical protein [unclassified Bradyrhizobium]MBR1217168.1 hypothetical protein [Bradyrhizobium sp. U87765 SZCCT0131]MBR1259076.1 hypothetical protein [Bradyrhizobium sp. U87765 SZCCT0134]MBR1305217.1 hypothetical protein [Bradyrhizobium sp. U87765 SZCCT0110]MBR1321003.1 hypothetical protein [Bradyrhizobium sp. U87765 SZCCT0109]MBR1350343.1 hypothetical protein [Bradyrhizobium sp. U87765 SZCCT0048]
MGKPKNKYDPTQNQDQAQANLQGQLQGQGQGQLNLQGQGQGQGQGQSEAQTAAQSLQSSSDNWNGNANGNGNLNGNGNFNGNLNANDNKNSNSADNKLSNGVDNKLDNGIHNTVDNKVDNTVNTCVDVKIDIGISASGLSAPVNDLHGMHDFSDSLVMPQSVTQTLNGDGGMFNIDQINNLVNNGTVTDPSVSYTGSGDPCIPSSGFHMDAKITGGEAKVDSSHTGDVAGANASGITASAAATLTQEAFVQTITLGANIQFNSLTVSNAGHDFTDSHNAS